jgi:hypothetical protein
MDDRPVRAARQHLSRQKRSVEFAARDPDDAPSAPRRLFEFQRLSEGRPKPGDELETRRDGL